MSSTMESFLISDAGSMALLDSKEAGLPTSPKRKSTGRRCCGKSGLAGFQRLTQPYFLPLGRRTHGCKFVGLLLSLVMCTVSIYLLLITFLLSHLAPQSLQIAFGGAGSKTLASSITTSKIAVLFPLAIGMMNFVANAKHLKRGRWLPWLLLGSILLLLLLENTFTAGLGFIQKDLVNSIIEKNEVGYRKTLSILAVCFMFALPIKSSEQYLMKRLGLDWRSWLTGNLINAYMANRAYFLLNPNDEEGSQVDNPDQRIAEDSRSFTTRSLSTYVGFFDATVTFCLNILVLWNIDHLLTFALIGYSVTSTVVTAFVGRKLVGLNFDQQRYEADFRYGLVHIRDNAEAIAFYRGEDPEKQETARRLGVLVGNFARLIKWETLVSCCKRCYFYGAVFIPYAIMAPRIFSDKFDFGSFQQAKWSFQMVEMAMSYFIIHMDDLASFAAGVSRLEEFQGKLVSLSNCESGQPRAQQENGDVSEPSGPLEICVRGVELRTPGSDRVLVRDLSFTVSKGDRLLVVGPSGCGKTSVMRMLSGLWQPSAGTVVRPPLGRLLFTPQRPYMLLGTLREQLCYPLDPSNFTDTELQGALRKVNLEALLERYPDLRVKQDWPRLLSLGEQQRLAFARLLLNSPDYVILDEATSALDVATERKLYELLSEKNTSCISVGHRPSLLQFHDQVLELSTGGSWRMMHAESYSFFV